MFDLLGTVLYGLRPLPIAASVVAVLPSPIAVSSAPVTAAPLAALRTGRAAARPGPLVRVSIAVEFVAVEASVVMLGIAAARGRSV